jgi:RNA polymerase sigma-70 factor (ECF subfamily)
MGPPGPYRLQAAIAAVHAAAPTAADTDWSEILRLHDLLVAASPGPIAEMNRAIAAAEVHGAERGLRLLEALGDDGRVAHQARYLAARGELLERLGRFVDAGAAFAAAARVAGTEAERRYLERRAGGTRGPTGEVDR